MQALHASRSKRTEALCSLQDPLREEIRFEGESYAYRHQANSQRPPHKPSRRVPRLPNRSPRASLPERRRGSKRTAQPAASSVAAAARGHRSRCTLAERPGRQRGTHGATSCFASFHHAMPKNAAVPPAHGAARSPSVFFHQNRTRPSMCLRPFGLRPRGSTPLIYRVAATRLRDLWDLSARTWSQHNSIPDGASYKLLRDQKLPQTLLEPQWHS